MDKGLSATVTRRLGRTMRNYAAGSKSARPTEGMATFVRRDQDGTCWVRFPGADIDTPVNGGILASAEPGQTVSYRIEGTRLTVTGNASDPAIGTNVVSKAIRESSDSLSSLFRTGIKKVFADVSEDIISIINSAASGGTIDVSKLNLTNYLTSTQVNGAISSAISSAFNMSSATSQIVQALATAFNYSDPNSYAGLFLAYLNAYVISPVVTTLNNNIASAISAIDVGGANLLNNTQWESAGDLKTATSLTEGKWYKDSYATATYSSGMLVVSTSRTSGHYGCTQKVAVEPSTKYVISAEVGSTYHIGIGSGTSPDDDGGWVEDGKRVWKAYETGANQAYAYVRMYAEGGGTPSPCVVNRIKLEKATTPSDYSPSNADTSDAVSEAARSATDFISVRDGITYIEAGSIEIVSDYGVSATSEFGSAQRVDLTSIPQVKSGVVGQTVSVPGNSYKEYEVANAFSYPSPPIIVACFNSTSTGATFGGLSIAVSSVTMTGFKVRIYNSTATDRSPGFYWIAVGSHPSA